MLIKNVIFIKNVYIALLSSISDPDLTQFSSSLIWDCAVHQLLCVDRRLCGDVRVVRRCWVNFQCRGVLLIWIIVGQGPIALAVGAGGGVWTFFLSSITSLFFLSLSGRRPDID